MNLIDLLHKGGPVIWVLAAYSSIGLAIVLARYLLFMTLRPLPTHFANQLNHLLDQPDADTRVAGLTGPQLHVLKASLAAVQPASKHFLHLGAWLFAPAQQRL